ncbi:restriction endonuclease subunit S [Escherichia fergusonii]|nr:restriction endonuclease subunit S [Escherichia fergusonii]
MSAGKLPEGWVECELSELGNIVTGKTPSTKEPSNFGGNIPFIKPGDLDLGGYIMNTADTLTEKGLSLVPTLPANSVVVTCIGNLGKVGITVKKSASNQQINALIPSEKLNVKFVYYQILTLKPWLESQSAATTIAIVNKSKFSQAPFKFPPLAEQKIIAEKLDTLLAQVDSTKTRLEQIPQILKRFRQAVLAAVVNGKLSKNTKQWEIYLLKNLCTSISDGDHQAPPKSETGIPFLVISDVNKGVIDFDNVSRWVPESYYQSLKEIRKPCQYDILYTVTGSYGMPVIVNNNKPFCFQRHIAIIKPNRNLIDHRFLAFYLESPQIFKHASDVATGTAQKTVSLSSLRNFEISVPPLKEQHEIVRRVEQLFAYADTIEKQVNNALARVNNLTQSILAKAFRGELTAQWRAENPDLISGENSAAALLEKIKAERAASGGKKASRKKS